MKTIDVTPTWGEWGNIFYHFALSGERNAVETMHRDMAKAFAAAQAFKIIQETMTDEQLQRANSVMEEELRKQGF